MTTHTTYEVSAEKLRTHELLSQQPEPFQFAGRRFDDPALLALCRVYGRDRVRNACIELDVLPYADTLKEILHWCHADDNAAIY